MKDNYSWLDSALDNIVVVNGQDYDAYAITETVDLAKQTIISQIEIEKLRARIDECQLWIDDFEQDFVNYNEEPKGSLVLKPTSVDRYIALDSIKEEIARLTEKLKELRR